MAERFDWDDLRYFLAVARAGTVSLAARRLRVDHATVIRRIDSLERALGANLFERNPRGYNLTQPGERLLVSGQRIEAEAGRVQEQVGNGGDSVSGFVRISSLEGFGAVFLAPRLARFSAAHPKLAVELLTIQQIIALSRREADLAITLEPPNTGRFVKELLTPYALGVYGARAYLDAAPQIASRSDLLQHPFSGYIDDLIFTRGLDYLQEVLPGLKPRLQSSSLQAQLEFAASGHGLCVLPAYMAARRPELVRVLPDEVSIERQYWLIGAADVAMTPGVRAVRRFIVEQVAEARALFGGAAVAA